MSASRPTRPPAQANMKLRISFLLTLVAMLVCQSTMAQDPLCSPNMTWRDATYAQRTSTMEGQSITAEFENFSNAWLVQFNDGLEKSAVISIKEKFYGEAITFTFGKDRPKPAEFSEIDMAVAPPMVDGDWPRMTRPCDVKDGSVVEFTETDMHPAKREHAQPVKFRGALRRQAMRFTYSIALEADGTDQAMSWQGEMSYGPATKIFDMATDVQGWHLYRANTFVKTIPQGKLVSLSTVLNEMASRSATGRIGSRQCRGEDES